MIDIRPLKKEDLTSLVDLYQLFWNERSDIERMKEKFAQLTDDPDYIFLCAVQEDRVVGTIQGVVCEELYGNCRPFLLMENFVVDKEYRRMGIGKKLLISLEQIAQTRNCTQILFITETDRKDTIGFYTSLGYSETTHVGFKKAL